MKAKAFNSNCDLQTHAATSVFRRMLRHYPAFFPLSLFCFMLCHYFHGDNDQASWSIVSAIDSTWNQIVLLLLVMTLYSYQSLNIGRQSFIYTLYIWISLRSKSYQKPGSWDCKWLEYPHLPSGTPDAHPQQAVLLTESKNSKRRFPILSWTSKFHCFISSHIFTYLHITNCLMLADHDFDPGPYWP